MFSPSPPADEMETMKRGLVFLVEPPHYLFPLFQLLRSVNSVHALLAEQLRESTRQDVLRRTVFGEYQYLHIGRVCDELLKPTREPGEL